MVTKYFMFILASLLLFACEPADKPTSEPAKENKIATDTFNRKKELPTDVIELNRLVSRPNFFRKLPAELIAFKKELPHCPFEETGCAGCGYCAWLKLSDDWSIFACERDVTKNSTEIFVYKQTNDRLELLQKLNFLADSIIPLEKNSAYSIISVDNRIDYYNGGPRHYYEFSKDRYRKVKDL